jgi:hypothetical protein
MFTPAAPVEYQVSLDAKQFKLYQEGKQWPDSLGVLCHYMDCTLEPKGRGRYVLTGATEDAAWMVAGYLSSILGSQRPRKVGAQVWELGN